MAQPHCLVVEDEEAIRRGLSDLLASQGYVVRVAADGAAGLAMALEEPCDLLLLDVMMPEIDGFTVCRRLREQRPRLPVIMLTAKGSEEDILHGFACGADDYVTKPFSVAQLLARVRAVLRRSEDVGEAPPVERLLIDDIECDGAALQLRRGDRCVDCSRRDYDLLATLHANAGRIVSRRLLLAQVWGYDHPEAVETRSVDMHIVKLRRKMQQGLNVQADEVIQTVRGEGYRLGWSAR